MAIVVNLDVMLAKRKMTSLELAQRVGITQANLSILKTGKAKAVRMHDQASAGRERENQVSNQPSDSTSSDFLSSGVWASAFFAFACSRAFSSYLLYL